MSRRRKTQTVTARDTAQKPLFLGYDAVSAVAGPAPLDAREAFGPARTLGGSEAMRLAQDTALAQAGVYSLLAHSMAMGLWGGATQFMGYAALQQIAQHGLLRACIETVADDMTRAWVDVLSPDNTRIEPTGATGATGPSPTGPTGASPTGASPTGPSPTGASPTGASAQGPSPTGPSPTGATARGASGGTGIARSPGTQRRATPSRDALCKALREHRMQELFHRACELVGYEGGCFLFIDTGVQGSALAERLDKSGKGAELRKGGPLRFQLLDPVNCAPGAYNATNPLAADYFVPEWWMVQQTRVHASRLIRMVANEPLVLMRPAYNFLGIPQAQLLWDYVLHFQENRDAANRLLNKFSLTAFKTSMEATLQQAGGVEQLDARMRMLARFRNNDGVLALDKDAEELIQLNTPLSGVRELVQQSLEHLAALNRTPAVKLLGISPSGFNATGASDIRNYYDHIRSQQEKVIRPALEEVFRVLSVHLYGTPDAGMSFVFSAMSEADEAAAANAQRQRAAALAALVGARILSPDEARQYLRDSPDSGFDFLEPGTPPLPGSPAAGDASAATRPAGADATA